MFTSQNLRKLVTHLLICSLFAAGLSGLMTRVGRANYLPPPPAPTAGQAVIPRAETLDEATRARVEEAYVNLPLSFEENRGQVDSEVRYLSRGAGYTLFLTPTEAVLSLRGDDVEMPDKKEGPRPQRKRQVAARKSRPAVLRMRLSGANPSPAITGEDVMKARANYLRGDDPQKWRTGVQRFERVRYAQVYPGVDVIYYGRQQQLEYDFEVSPGADARRIVLEFSGVSRVEVERATGELVLKPANGEVRQRKPAAYQEVGGVRREVASRYVMKGRNRVGVEVGEYDRAKPLVIDPILTYSTYLGGTDSDYASGIAVDSSGHAYVAGHTYATNFPTRHQYQSWQGTVRFDSESADAFITKLDTNASGPASLLYSTYLGGSAADYSMSIAADDSGNAYVAGWTDSKDFPLLHQLQKNQPGQDAFVTMLDTNQAGAASLRYSTYLGGKSSDSGEDIAVDSAGNVYVTGGTYSSDFPLLNQYQSGRGSSDAFVTKLNPNLAGADSLVYSTFLGGTGGELGYGIAVDSSGVAYVTGWTESPDFPTLNAFQPDKAAGPDAFVAKLDTNVSGTAALLYSTYLGGDEDDWGEDIATDSSGNAYVTGETISRDFPTRNQIHKSKDSWDAFVTKLDTNQAGAASLRYSTYLGGTGYDWGFGIAVDQVGNVYVAGMTESTDFPTRNALQRDRTYAFDDDAFVTKLNPRLAGRDSILYSTYLGGNNGDFAYAIAVDSSRNAYVTGEVFSTDFPRVKAYQSHHIGYWMNSAFVTKLADSYRIRGQVTSDGTTGISAVTMTISGAEDKLVLTNGNGYYSFDLLADGDYTLTPSKDGLTFLPSGRSFVNLRQSDGQVNFTTRGGIVSGRVTAGGAAGAGLEGVTVTLTGGDGFAPRTATTTSNGDYSFSNLPTPRSYKVTASKTNYDFSPAQLALLNLTADQAGANFVASPKTYTVGGVVRLGSAGLGGVKMRLASPAPAGFRERTVTTDSAGAYSFSNVPAGRDYTVTPVSNGYQFAQANRTLANLSDDQASVNFSVTVFSISGRVTRAGTGTGVGGVTIVLTSPTPSGFAARTAETSGRGYYTFLGLPAGRDYTIKPAKSGFTFSPATRGVTDLGGNVPTGPSTSFNGSGP